MKSEATLNQEALQEFKECLSSFNYSDFVEGDEPYVLLEESSVNADIGSRLTQILEKRAQQCGVPIRMVRNILKERRGNVVDFKPQESGGMFDFDGQPIELRCGKYVSDSNRVCIETANGLQVVCNHPLIPSKRYINAEAGTESLEISFKREYWKSVMVDRGTLSSASTIIQLANHGVSVTSETARELVKYLSYIDDINRDIIPIEATSSHLGWLKGSEFVPYTEGITYDSQGQFGQMYRTIHESGKYDRWLESVKVVRADGSVPARIVLAASFASVLLEKFDALPFFVHLWSAQSGTGKTVTMELAASVWADPQVGAYCRPLRSTNVGLEQLAIFTCNLPLCLDELQSIQNKGNFDDIVYGLCEGSGKTRGAKNGGLRVSQSWKNVIITTGEMPIVSNGSKAGAMNRVLEIECKGATMPDAKAIHKVISNNYGFAGKMFLNAIADLEVLNAIEDEQQEIFERLSEIGTDKQALSASILLAADHAIERIIFHDGKTLTERDILPYLRTSNDVDSGRRAHEYLMEWVAENRQGFIVDGAIDDQKTKTLGCIDTDKATENVKEIWIIAKSFSQAMNEGGFNPDSYLSWALGEGLLKTKDGQKKIIKRLPKIGLTARCVCIQIETDSAWGTIVRDLDLPFA